MPLPGPHEPWGLAESPSAGCVWHPACWVSASRTSRKRHDGFTSSFGRRAHHGACSPGWSHACGKTGLFRRALSQARPLWHSPALARTAQAPRAAGRVASGAVCTRVRAGLRQRRTHIRVGRALRPGARQRLLPCGAGAGAPDGSCIAQCRIRGALRACAVVGGLRPAATSTSLLSVSCARFSMPAVLLPSGSDVPPPWPATGCSSHATRGTRSRRAYWRPRPSTRSWTRSGCTGSCATRRRISSSVFGAGTVARWPGRRESSRPWTCTRRAALWRAQPRGTGPSASAVWRLPRPLTSPGATPRDPTVPMGPVDCARLMQDTPFGKRQTVSILARRIRLPGRACTMRTTRNVRSCAAPARRNLH